MSDFAELARVEGHLSAALKDVSDRKGENLLRRESGGVALLPEASRLLARTVAFGVVHDLAAVLGDLRAAYHASPGEPEPDWNRVGHAIAFTAMRRAGQGLNLAHRRSRAERDVEGAP